MNQVKYHDDELQVVNSCFLSPDTRAHCRFLSPAQQGQTAHCCYRRDERGREKDGEIEQTQRDPVTCGSILESGVVVPFLFGLDQL